MGERSKAGNAARLEAMAADSFAKVFGPDAARINRAVDGISDNDPERDMAAAAVAYIEVLDEVQAELDRLRVIVDAAIAARESQTTYLGRSWEGRQPERDQFDRLWALIAREVRHRA
jgi:hypothetical protein